MADDKKERGAADRRWIASGRPYELAYFARKHRISRDQARRIIERWGPDRDKANRGAERISRRA